MNTPSTPPDARSALVQLALVFCPAHAEPADYAGLAHHAGGVK